MINDFENMITGKLYNSGQNELIELENKLKTHIEMEQELRTEIIVLEEKLKLKEKIDLDSEEILILTK